MSTELRPYLQINTPTDEQLGFHFPDLTNPQESLKYIQWAQEFLQRHPPTEVTPLKNMGPMSIMKWDVTAEDEFAMTAEGTRKDESGQDVRKRVLVFSPHSDDTEITATALIQDFKQRGYGIDVLLLTAGSAGKYKLPLNEQTHQEVRVAEQLRAASMLGANRVFIPQLPLEQTQEVQEAFQQFPVPNDRDFQYGITEWFWDDIYGGHYGVNPERLGIAIRTFAQPSVIISPHPDSDTHEDHIRTSRAAKMMWKNGSSKSNYQHAYPGTLPLEAWYRTVVWGEAGTPTPNFNEFVQYSSDGQIAVLKTRLLHAFPSQSDRYTAAQMGMDLGVGMYNTIGQRGAQVIAQERFDVLRGPTIRKPQNSMPDRNYWT